MKMRQVNLSRHAMFETGLRDDPSDLALINFPLETERIGNNFYGKTED